LEEFIGEIEDEYDDQEYVEKQIGENKYIFSGRLEIDYLNEKYGLGIPVSEEYETLAGFILEHHNDIPKVNDEIQIGKYKIKILSSTNMKIEKVGLEIIETKED
jgi:CBS domain containing-hemolysin-like protein